MVSLFPIYSDVCLIHSYYSFISLICFDIHAFTSKPIHHLNVKDKTLQEFNAMDFQKRETGKLYQRRTLKTKKITEFTSNLP